LAAMPTPQRPLFPINEAEPDDIEVLDSELELPGRLQVYEFNDRDYRLDDAAGRRAELYVKGWDVLVHPIWRQ
jgi:hypothetical protein